MSFADISSREAIRAAVAEYDQLGREQFLAKYGFHRARSYLLVIGDREYDSKAIVGAAHGYQFPHLGPLPATQFSGGAATVKPLLERLGFKVRVVERRARGTQKACDDYLDAALRRMADPPMDREANLRALYPELAAGASVPNGPLGPLKLRFADAFAFWGIGLPEDDVTCRRRGSISKSGWSIDYLFGRDERGEFLDYYAHHRMTNDRHTRVYEDGSVEGLPVMQDMMLCSDDEAESARLKAEFLEHNRRVGEILKAKGF